MLKTDDTPADISSIHTDAVLSDLALHWLNADGRARMIVGADGVMIWTNREAADVLKSETHVKARNNRLSGTSALHQVVLTSLFSEAVDREQQAILTNERGQHLLVIAQPLPTQPIRIGLLLLSAETHISRYFDFKQLFGLTTAEARLLAELLAGRPAEQAASQLSVSVQTVRSHIRHIYTKLNVSSREELFSLAARYRV